jgi:hypothetical protein
MEARPGGGSSFRVLLPDAQGGRIDDELESA